MSTNLDIFPTSSEALGGGNPTLENPLNQIADSLINPDYVSPKASSAKELQEVIKQVRIQEVGEASQPIVERKERGIRLTPLLCATIVGLTRFLTSCSDSPKGETCGNLANTGSYTSLPVYKISSSEDMRNLQRQLVSGDTTGMPAKKLLCDALLSNQVDGTDGTTGKMGEKTANALVEANAEAIKIYNEALKIYNQNPRGAIKPVLNLVYDVR